MYTVAKRAIKSLVPEATWNRFYGRHYDRLRPLIVDHCPVMLPWMSAGFRAHPVTALHRLAVASPDHGRVSLSSLAIRSAALLVWPFRLLALSGEQLRKNAVAVRELYGITVTAQLAGMLRAALLSNVAPESYYRFRLFKPENARRAHEYLQADELDGLHGVLTSSLPSLEPLEDKERFFHEGSAQGLPVVPLAAAFEGDAVRWYEGRALPACDLILKPAHELSGRGVERWLWDAGSETWRHEGQALAASELLERCRAAGRIKKYLVQRRISNHVALEPLAPNSLATLRVVTYRRPSGQAGIIMTGLRMPTGGKCVDNFSAGGIAAPVGERGVLGPAVAKDPTRGVFDNHPDSRAPITGRVLPYYREALELAVRAHAVFSWAPTVGWDVVIEPAGPSLLEANPSWGFELAQIVPGTPLGATPYVEVFLEHLAAQAARPPAAFPASVSKGVAPVRRAV